MQKIHEAAQNDAIRMLCGKKPMIRSRPKRSRLPSRESLLACIREIDAILEELRHE